MWQDVIETDEYHLWVKLWFNKIFSSEKKSVGLNEIISCNYFLRFFSGKRTHVALVCCHLLTKMFYVFLLPEIHLHTISYLTLVSAYCMKAWEYLLPIAPLTVPFLRSFYPGVQRFHQILTHQCMQVWNKECNGGNMLDMLHFLKAYLPAAINILNPLY